MHPLSQQARARRDHSRPRDQLSLHFVYTLLTTQGVVTYSRAARALDRFQAPCNRNYEVRQLWMDQSREKEAKGRELRLGRREPSDSRRRVWVNGERRGWDLNPRATFRPPAVFKTAPFDRSGTPPNHIVAEAGFARLRSNSRGTVPAGGCPRNACWDRPRSGPVPGRVAGAQRRIEGNARRATGAGGCLAGAR